MVARPLRSLRKNLRWRRILVIFLVISTIAGFSAQPLAQFFLRAWIIRSIKRQCACDVFIGAIDISFLQRAVRVHDLRVEAGGRDSDDQAPLVIELAELDANPSWKALLHGRLDAQVIVSNPRLTLLAPDRVSMPPSQFWNWSEGLTLAARVHLRRLIVHNGMVIWRQHEPASTLRVTSIEIDAAHLGNTGTKPGTIRATAVVTGDGEAEVAGTLDLFAPNAFADLGIILRGLRLESFDPLWRQAMDIEVQHGRLDAYASLSLRDGMLSGFVKPLVSDLDLSDVSDNLRRYGLAAAISSSAKSAAWKLLGDRAGNITTRVPLEVRLDQSGSSAAFAEATRAVLLQAMRQIPAMEIRLGLSAWSDREWRLALDALRVRGQFWRYGLGLATRRDEQRTSMSLECVGGPGMDVGRVRLELLPRLGIGGARDHDDSGFTLAYGAGLDATFPAGPAVVGIRAGWEAEETFGAARNVDGPMIGFAAGWRF